VKVKLIFLLIVLILSIVFLAESSKVVKNTKASIKVEKYLSTNI
jgi:hypothetical protein